MKVRLALSLALLLICTGAALATTPDGETPAQETVCDGETGAAYGLCNAYCEAMDCDSDNAQASEMACTKVQDKFTNITGRDLPCEAAPTCPPPPPGTTCPCADNNPLYAEVLNSPGQCEDAGVAATKTNASGTAIAATCFSPVPNSGFCATNVGGAAFITQEEGSFCVQQILDSCNPE